jgi:hypothetical protein
VADLYASTWEFENGRSSDGPTGNEQITEADLLSTGATLSRLALALEGVSSAPHFDRTAFKVKRTFVTLAADGLTANFKFSPDEQQLKCAVHPEAFAPVPNAWGQQGWTIGTLSKLGQDDLASALNTAWRHALPTPRKSPESGRR